MPTVVILADAGGVGKGDNRQKHADGGWRWILNRGRVAEWDADGAPVRVSGTRLDITARKEAEQALAKSAVLIGRELGLSGDDLETIELAAQVHDIGKIGVPAEIRARPGTLASAEMAIVHLHPEIGYDILASIEFQGPIVEAMASHRPYRPALGIDLARHEIRENSGVLYDAAMVAACERCSHDSRTAS